MAPGAGTGGGPVREEERDGQYCEDQDGHDRERQSC